MKHILKSGFLILSLVALASCMKPKAASESSNEVDTIALSIPVRVSSLEKSSITRTLDYTANLAAFKEINYAPASPGRIDKINVEVGSRVRKGQVLVELDRTQLIQAQTQLSAAKDSYQRIDTLFKMGSISEQQYEQTKTQYDLAQTNVEFLLKNTTLKSPIDGIVTGKYFENGELYSGAPNTAAGKAAVISLMQINPLKALVSISQTNYAGLKEGMTAQISTDILPEVVFNGKITKVYPTIDAATRTFKVEILVDNKEEKLRPGMFANIQINLEEAETFLVPAIAVIKQSGTDNRFVYFHQNGKARQVEVAVGKRYNDQLEIISPELQAGMELIVEGQAKLIQGSEIQVVRN